MIWIPLTRWVVGFGSVRAYGRSRWRDVWPRRDRGVWPSTKTEATYRQWGWRLFGRHWLATWERI